jgi:adenosylcobinamide kinase/adenosylcobinamide-phosphate guanylyltransferase
VSGKELIFVLGGARGGKSTYAERLAAERGGGDVLFVATAQALDDEMRERIAAHQAARPQGWRTLEAPSLASAPLVEAAAGAGAVLVDCLTLLASNALLSGGDAAAICEREAQAKVEVEVDALLSAYAESDCPWIVVSNEVGLGIVPENPLARMYRDVLGRANQRVAEAADTVWFLVAGLPQRLK